MYEIITTFLLVCTGSAVTPLFWDRIKMTVRPRLIAIKMFAAMKTQMDCTAKVLRSKLNFNGQLNLWESYLCNIKKMQ